MEFEILKNTYIDLLKKYFKKASNRKLKYQYTDTTIIPNKYGSDLVKYNGYKKRSQFGHYSFWGSYFEVDIPNHWGNLPITFNKI